MPVPDDVLERYVCPDKNTIVYYRHHASIFRMETPVGIRVGSMHYDQIEWDDYDLAAAVLGIQPPTNIKYGDLHLLRLGGGQFNDAECHAQAPHS